MSGPLEGVKLIDLSMNVMGPYATQILGDMGADVIKIEPLEGDTSRGIGPTHSPKMGPLFLALNRNKRSLALDLKTDAGYAVMRRLIERSDALLYTVRPKSMDRLRLSYDEVAAINPRMIYCGAYGFGQKGPYADRPAYDDLIQGMLGITVLQARKGEDPRFVVPTMVDRSIGIAAAACISMALYRRERSGRGQSIELPMFEWMAQYVLGDHMWGLSFEPPEGEFGYPRILNPHRRPYKTKDGYVCVLVYTDRHWKNFFTTIGRPELAADPRYATITERTKNITELYAFVGEVLATKTTAEWLAQLEQADLAAGRVSTPQELLEDPHMKAVNFFPVVDHPTEGKIRGFGVPTTWSESQPDIRSLPPLVGQHTMELLRELDYGQTEIDALIQSGVAVDAAVGQPK